MQYIFNFAGIYPHWPMLMMSIKEPLTPADKLYAKYQESVRKVIRLDDTSRTHSILAHTLSILTH